MINRKTFVTTTALVAALTLTLSSCGNGDATDDQPAGETADESPDETADGGSSQEPITIAIHAGWDEGIAVSYLWEAALKNADYEVELADPAEAGPNYAAIAGGAHDINFDMMLPNTHADYLEEYEDETELFDPWYHNGSLTIAVNEDAPITSLSELADHADDFNNKIVGIEPGAGLTKVTKEAAIPTYGLEEMELVEASTPAMLAELKGATEAGENIVVTLWHPHWAYDVIPVRDLEDPENAMGDPEVITSIARKGFSADYPEVADAINAFELSDEQLSSLENIMFNEDDGEDPEDSVQTWLEEEENKVFFDSMLG